MTIQNKIENFILWLGWRLSVGVLTLTLYLLIYPLAYLEEKIYDE